MVESIEKRQGIQQAKRYIGKAVGDLKGPTLIFFGGIHGNEPSGVTALEHIFEKLNTDTYQIRGAIYGIRGNIPALLQGKRFLDDDLNRLWTAERITEIKSKTASKCTIEELELLKIEQAVLEIITSRDAPFYFIDFHTTSSKTLPFVTISDALINRKFSRLFPVPIVLGIEEYLEGPLLSHMNQKGYVSLGFESGQHTEKAAVSNSIAFVWLTLVFASVIAQNEVPDFDSHYHQLSKSAAGNSAFYEIIHRQALTTSDDFSMLKGFKSFQKVTKGTALAIKNKKTIFAKKDTTLFMPLYQEQGAEAFFLIKSIPSWALSLSAFLRKTKFDRLLTFLPGISWSGENKESLLVNLLVARFFAKSFFHLLGYRHRKADKTHIIMQNRELTAKNEMYRTTSWY